MSGQPLFMVGVDTEADDQWTLEGRKRLSVENALALPRLQALCDAYGVRPSYLVTHEMATREPSQQVLGELAATGRCEIGAHLHPWSSPPYREEDLVGRYPSELEDSLLETQLSELTTAIETSVGVRPVSYRAGRHGFDTRSLRILEKLGYRVDTSVDPLFNERRKGGPSFAGAPVSPYWPSHADVRHAGHSTVLEIPVSSSTAPWLPKILEKQFASLPAIPWRGVLKRLGIRAVWLRPSYSSVEDAKALASSLVARSVPTLNMLFHSSELIPGGSPYNKDAADVDRFFDRLEQTFDHIVKRLQARGVTYAECADALQLPRPVR
jgi:peptidoglycan/xylan/chitin deacetylase (PgdA/CDA1 family)